MKTIDIIIPTHNRNPFLVKNLNLLIDCIHALKAMEYISIYVSDNCSTDGTSEAVQKIIEKTDVRIILFIQKNNIGPINNFKYLVKHANAEFLMLLGDDDYINIHYLSRVIKYLNSDKGITAIVPNGYNTQTWKYRVPIGKDTILGWPDSLSLILHATQMSGLVFQREGLSEEVENLNLGNAYLSVFFVGYSAKNGKIVHIKSSPIEITIPAKRPWEYSEDMFFDDLCENFVFLGLDCFRRAYCEMRHISGSAVSYTMLGIIPLFKVYRAMLKGRNITGLTKVLFPVYIACGMVRGVTRRLRFVLSPDKERYIHNPR